MLSYNAAATLLGLCNIPDVIQKQILLLFIGFGTHTSNMIKKQTEFTADCYTFNGYLVKSAILENDAFTLWRLNVFLNGCKVFQKFTLKNLNVLHELRLAYISDGTVTWERMAKIMSLNETLKNRRDVELFEMFYGLDKYNWEKYPIGTQTSIIIHNAIENKIIKVIDPTLHYGVDDIDPDGKYY